MDTHAKAEKVIDALLGESDAQVQPIQGEPLVAEKLRGNRWAVKPKGAGLGTHTSDANGRLCHVVYVTAGSADEAVEKAIRAGGCY